MAAPPSAVSSLPHTQALSSNLAHRPSWRAGPVYPSVLTTLASRIHGSLSALSGVRGLRARKGNWVKSVTGQTLDLLPSPEYLHFWSVLGITGISALPPYPLVPRLVGGTLRSSFQDWEPPSLPLLPASPHPTCCPGKKAQKTAQKKTDSSIR